MVSEGEQDYAGCIVVHYCDGLYVHDTVDHYIIGNR